MKHREERPRRGRFAQLAVTAGVLAIACWSDRHPVAPVSHRLPGGVSFDAVPSSPPNMLPPDLTDDDSLVSVAGGNAIHRTLLWVQFFPGTDSITKQVAVDSVHGEIAGGYVIDASADLGLTARERRSEPGVHRFQLRRLRASPDCSSRTIRN
jgi:hypothetical protein